METYIITLPPDQAPDQTVEIALRFDEGRPVALDGDELPFHEIIGTLNQIGGKFSVGRIDTVENRLMDHKTREIYEQPAATLLHRAYVALEELVQPRSVIELKKPIEREYGKLVYSGKWFSKEREGLDSFFERINKPMNGVVRLRIHLGLVRVVGRKSDSSTLDEDEVQAEIGELKSQIKDSSSLSSFLP